MSARAGKLFARVHRSERGDDHWRWPIRDVLAAYEWDGRTRAGGRGASTRCPFHDDSDASAVVYDELNAFRCFACDARGNSVTLTMQQEGLSAKDAVERLGSPDQSPTQRRRKRRLPWEVT